MKRFKFRLETVLQHRERERDEAKAVLVKANQALSEAEQEKSRLRHLELENALSIQEVSSVAQVRLNDLVASGLRQRIANQSKLIEQRQEAVAKAMDAFKVASMELKTVTTLKERKLQEYNKHVAEAELAFLDELATQRSAAATKRG